MLYGGIFGVSRVTGFKVQNEWHVFLGYAKLTKYNPHLKNLFNQRLNL